MNDWVVATLLVFLGFALLVFLGMSVYFAVMKPDLLRSEQYTLQKLALESRLGDDRHGFQYTESDKIIDVTAEPDPKVAMQEARKALPSEAKRKTKQGRPKSTDAAAEGTASATPGEEAAS